MVVRGCNPSTQEVENLVILGYLASWKPGIHEIPSQKTKEKAWGQGCDPGGALAHAALGSVVRASWNDVYLSTG